MSAEEIEIPVRVVLDQEELRQLVTLAREFPELKRRVEALEKVAEAISVAVLGADAILPGSSSQPSGPSLDDQVAASLQRLRRSRRSGR